VARRQGQRHQPHRGHQPNLPTGPLPGRDHRLHADAAGDDRRNRNGEYALVRNTGKVAINLAGWKLDAGDLANGFPC
jgi:hypothetical protein